MENISVRLRVVVFFFLIKAFLVFQTKKNHSESDYLVISPLPPSARQDLLIIQDS